jgi:hypothetical protein
MTRCDVRVCLLVLVALVSISLPCHAVTVSCKPHYEIGEDLTITYDPQGRTPGPKDYIQVRLGPPAKQLGQPCVQADRYSTYMAYGTIQPGGGTNDWQAVTLYPSSLHVDWCYNNQPAPDDLIATSQTACDMSSVYTVKFRKAQYEYGEPIVVDWTISSTFHDSSDLILIYRQSNNWVEPGGGYLSIGSSGMNGSVTFLGTTYSIRQDIFTLKFKTWQSWTMAYPPFNATIVNTARICADQYVTATQLRTVNWNASLWHVNGDFIATHWVSDCAQNPCVCARTCPGNRHGTVGSPTLGARYGSIQFSALNTDPGQFFYVYWSSTNEALAWTPYLSVGTPNGVQLCSAAVVQSSSSTAGTGSSSSSSGGNLSGAEHTASGVLAIALAAIQLLIALFA